jgi:hypothetical protein
MSEATDLTIKRGTTARRNQCFGMQTNADNNRDGFNDVRDEIVEKSVNTVKQYYTFKFLLCIDETK